MAEKHDTMPTTYSCTYPNRDCFLKAISHTRCIIVCCCCKQPDVRPELHDPKPLTTSAQGASRPVSTLQQNLKVIAPQRQGFRERVQGAPRTADKVVHHKCIVPSII